MLIATVGGLITGALLISAIQKATSENLPRSASGGGHEPLDDAVLSLDSKVPVRLRKRRGMQDTACVRDGSRGARPCAGSIRIRSGDYLSPSIRVTDSPRRIAVPFPAPYPNGRGFLSVEGSARGLTVWLSPGRYVGTLDGAAPITVVWTPKNPC